MGSPCVADEASKLQPVRVQGSALAHWLFTRLGWTIHFDGIPARQGVLIVYPHTSNWDFFILILAKWAIGLPVKFWGKDSLFKVPVLGRWMRWVGGVPVERHVNQGAVGAMTRRLMESKQADSFFWLALAPEGTRKWLPGWRSGFYQVALGAQVPLGICCVNFPQKTVRVTEFLHLTGQVNEDMQRIARALQGAVGKNPAQAAPIQLISK